MRYKYIDTKFKNFIININNYFKNSDDVLFDKRNIIKIVELDKQKYVVKSFKKPHLLNQVVYRFFRDSKAKRSYSNTIKLQELGVNVPNAIGYIEYNLPCRLQSSYFVSEFYDYDFEIRDELNSSDFDDRERILEEFASFSYDLHQKRVYHIDYSPGNVLIKKQNSSYEFAIIDVNRMKFIEFDNELRFKNLSRFSTSLEDLELIAYTYAKVANIDKDYAHKTLLKYHNRHQEYLQNKQKIKKLKGKK
jgi:serine/threonine protein kinase